MLSRNPAVPRSNTPWFSSSSWLAAVMAAVMGVAAAQVSSPNAGAETWTNLNGTKSIDAKMIGLWGDTLILQLPTGRRVAVKLSTLRGESRIQAQQLHEEIAAARAQRIEELKRQVADQSSPAPAKLPVPPAVPDYTPPAADLPIGEFLKQFNQALTNGHVRVLYDALPPDHRKDVREVIQAAAEKMNPQTWQALIGTPHQFGDLIVTRQNWLFSSPRFGNFPPEQRKKIQGSLLSWASILRQGLSPDSISLESLQSGDFEEWLSEWDATLAPYVAEMIAKMGLDLQATTSVVSESEGTAVVSTAYAGEPTEQTWVLVDGYWIEQSKSDSWEEEMAARKQEIADAADGKYMATQALLAGAVSPMLETLAKADSAAAYHAALDEILPKIQAVIPVASSGSKPTATTSATEDATDQSGDKPKSRADILRDALGSGR